MTKAVPRYSTCPCRSDRKYKPGCLESDRSERSAERIPASFTLEDGSKTIRAILALDSVPTHNANGLQPNLSKEQTLQVLLDELERDLAFMRVELLSEATNRLVARMNIVPKFTYRDVGNAVEADKRFVQYMMQIVCLVGEDPLTLFFEKLGSNSEP